MFGKLLHMERLFECTGLGHIISILCGVLTTPSPVSFRHHSPSVYPPLPPHPPSLRSSAHCRLCVRVVFCLFCCVVFLPHVTPTTSIKFRQMFVCFRKRKQSFKCISTWCGFQRRRAQLKCNRSINLGQYFRQGLTGGHASFLGIPFRSQGFCFCFCFCYFCLFKRFSLPPIQWLLRHS